MAYVPPSLNTYQNFEQAMSENTLPLYACVVAPHYGMHRYSVEAEKALLGTYDAVVGNTFTSWPAKTAGGTVDTATAMVHVEDALLQSLDFTMAGWSSSGSEDGVTVANGNKIRSASYVFQTGNGHDRSGVFGTRDVQAGDPVIISYTDSEADPQTLSCTVLGLAADVIAADIAATTAGADNATDSANSSSSSSSSSTAATIAVSGTLYKGIKYGVKTETYRVTALADGTAGPVSVISGSGTDDISSVAVTNGVAQALGTRGATFTITGEMTTGDNWLLTVQEAFTKNTPASSGTYTGSADTTYIVTVTSGGKLANGDTILFSSTTLDGSDGITEISAAAAGTYAIGVYGPEITVPAAAQYNMGDTFLVAVTAETADAYKTLILSKSLALCPTTTSINAKLCIKDTIELDVANWTATSAEIVVSAGAEQAAWYTGASKLYPVLSGTLYMDYRERMYATAQAVGSVTNVADVEALLGPSIPENPLSLGVYQACVGSAGTTVYYIGVNTDDVEGYSFALDKLTDILEPYSIIPYTNTQAVRDLVQAWVNARSAADVAMFGIAWFGIDEARTAAYYTKLADGENILATGTGDVLTADGALFGIEAVRPGDTVRIKYRPDGHGNTIYDTYTVDQVLTDETLQLTTDLDATISTAVKMEVWRTATESELAARIQAWATHHADRRVRCVWSEAVSALGYTDLPKFALACVLAGMRSALAPHQPMTNVNVTGIDLVYSVNFGATLLNQMAGNGVWLVVKNVAGDVYTRHQVTTDNTDINRREDTITTNLDQICRDFKDGMSDLIGRGNVSDAMLEIIRSRVHSLANSITARPFADLIGPQLQELKITKLYIDPAARDHVWLELEPTLPYPLNNLNVVFRVI